MTKEQQAMMRVELAPVPRKYLPGLERVTMAIQSFHIANIPYAEDGFLYSDSFRELSDFIYTLRQPREKVAVIIKNPKLLGEEPERRFQQIVSAWKSIRSLEGLYILTDVNEKLLTQLLLLSWDIEWVFEPMWIAIGPESAGEEIANSIEKHPIELLDLVHRFPVIIERGHDAAYLQLYSSRHSLQDVKETLESVLARERFYITVTYDYDQTDWSRSWQEGYNRKEDGE